MTEKQPLRVSGKGKAITSTTRISIEISSHCSQKAELPAAIPAAGEISRSKAGTIWPRRVLMLRLFFAERAVTGVTAVLSDAQRALSTLNCRMFYP
ncbi:hypothetical protein [Sinorhizobium chiapasense]|uniref:Uncharacterized protein n=1 Tax=Sinorhizobium chiapasense TaxID=501572 RepID=A0ABZ2B4U1_9HYPH